MAESSTRTVERAFALLAVVSETEPISLADAARETGLSAATALRLLRTMESLGFVRKDDAGYRPGMRVIQLGAHALARHSLAALAEPAMARLVAATGESTYLAVPSGHDAEQGVYIAVKEGTHSVRHTSWVGRSVPLSGSAVGHALRAADDGFVVSSDGVENDVTAIAAPVRFGGGVVAALSVIAPSYRVSAERAAQIGAEVVAEVAALSAPPANTASGPAEHPAQSTNAHEQPGQPARPTNAPAQPSPARAASATPEHAQRVAADG